jgi:hypothetical protein
VSPCFCARKPPDCLGANQRAKKSEILVRFPLLLRLTRLPLPVAVRNYGQQFVILGEYHSFQRLFRHIERLANGVFANNLDRHMDSGRSNPLSQKTTWPVLHFGSNPLNPAGGLITRPSFDVIAPRSSRYPSSGRYGRRIPMKSNLPEVKELCKAAFPNYRGRKFSVEPFNRPMRLDSCWEGGSRSFYVLLNMATKQQVPVPENGTPYSNGGRILQCSELPMNVALVEHCIFCGHDIGCRVYVRPENLAKLLPTESAA